MRTFKLTLALKDGTKVWINPQYIIKMEKTINGEYYIFLINGEKYFVSPRIASTIEDCLEG